MTRILSVFNLLTRVGFAVLFFESITVNAEWYTDPENPDWHWATTGRPTIVSDGLGGAFFAFCTIDDLWPHIGHVNADGEFTFPRGNEPYEYMLPIDLQQYAGTPLGVTLVSSEPQGTVIAIAERVSGGLYGGLVFSKFDTSGLTGFGTVGSADIGYRMDPVPIHNDSGWVYAASNGAGGVHYIIRTQGTGSRYYSLLDSSGSFVHGWPGLSIGATYRTLYSDGFDGVFLLGQDESREDSITLLRFNPQGEPLLGIEGMALVPDGDEVWLSSAGPISAGIIVFWRAIETVPDSFDHIAYAIDTSGSHVWPQEGVLFDCGGQEIGEIVSDRIGGLFFNRPATAGNPGSCHYDHEANLISTGAMDTWIRYPDEFGGGYGLRIAFNNTTHVWLKRYDSSLNTVWPDSVVVMNVPFENWGGAGTPDGFAGIIGIWSTNRGTALYHVNSDGSLGDYSESRELPTLPASFSFLRAYPNPFNDALNVDIVNHSKTRLTIQVMDVLGRTVYSQTELMLGTGKHTYVLSIGSIASGTYFVRASSATSLVRMSSNTARVIHLK